MTVARIEIISYYFTGQEVVEVEESTNIVYTACFSQKLLDFNSVFFILFFHSLALLLVLVLVVVLEYY